MPLSRLGRGLATLWRTRLKNHPWPWAADSDPRNARRVRNMEVTLDNFSEKLPEVLSAVEAASFVAVDGEFTGIQLDSSSRHMPFDTAEERYEKLAEGARRFQLVQFGLCTFHYDREGDCYSNQAFNFYVWPRPYARNAPDRKFLCQASSLDFLMSQNFDFNKLISKGISYLNPVDYQDLREKLLEKQAERSSQAESLKNASPGEIAAKRMRTAVPESDIKIIDKVHSDIESDLMSGKKEEVRLPGLSPFQRKLVYETVGMRHRKVAVRKLLEREGGDSPQQKVVLSLVLRKEEDGPELGDKAELDALDEALGFTKVISGLSKSGKLIVGHNMTLDLLHTIESFVSPLPKEYTDFKSVCASSFPRIVDTKLMASTQPLRDEIPYSSLGELKQVVSAAPFDLPEVRERKADCGYVLSDAKYHEAGYDAFVTGLCFIAMSNRMGAMSQDKDARHSRTGRPRVLPDSPLVAPFLNKLHVMRMPDVPYLDLAGPDPDPPREHVFHLTFPKDWKVAQIVDLFSPLGGVHVSFINDTTAFVSLSERENAPKVLSSLNWGGRISVMPFAQFKALERRGGSNGASFTGQSCGLTPMLENANISFSSAFSTPPPPPQLAHLRVGASPGGEGGGAASSSDSSFTTPSSSREMSTVARTTPQQQQQQQRNLHTPLSSSASASHHKRRLNTPSSAPFKRQKSVADGGGGAGDGDGGQKKVAPSSGEKDKKTEVGDYFQVEEKWD